MNTNDDEPNEISNNKEDTEPQNSNHEGDNSEKNETTVDESKHTDNENKLQPFPEMIKICLIDTPLFSPTTSQKMVKLLPDPQTNAPLRICRPKPWAPRKRLNISPSPCMQVPNTSHEAYLATL